MVYKIQKEESRRLDALKVLMCVFVLMIHAFSDDHMGLGWSVAGAAYQVTFVVSRVICDCAVPVFILISSVLLYAKPFRWWENVKKKCRTLLVPYLIFDTAWVLMMLGKGFALGQGNAFAGYAWFDWLDAYLGLTGDYKPVLTTLWYVRDLFLLNLLAIPIKKLIDCLPIPVMVLTLVVWVADIRIPGIQAYSLPFFLFGYYMVKYGIHLEDIDRKLPMAPLAVVYGALTVAVVALQRDVEAVNRLYLLVAVLFWIRCSGWLARADKAIGLVLPGTFFIYLTHRFIYAIIQMVTDGSVKKYLIAYPVKPVLALTVSLAVFYAMKKLMPRVLAVMIGGRSPKAEAGRGRP